MEEEEDVTQDTCSAQGAENKDTIQTEGSGIRATKSLPGLALVKGEFPAGIGNWFHIHTSSKSCTPYALSAASLQMHHRDSQ